VNGKKQNQTDPKKPRFAKGEPAKKQQQEKPKEQPQVQAPAYDTAKTEVPVPETLKKKKKAMRQFKKDKRGNLIRTTTFQKMRRRQIYIRARKYAREYRLERNKLISLGRVAKSSGNFYVKPEPKIAVVVRIRGILGVAPKTKKILRLLRLRQLHNAVFVRLNKPMINMLRVIEPYVTYGYPNHKTVKHLIYKRGYGRIHRQRIPLVNNHLIEKSLGKKNILCIEDLIHEIYTCGPNFKIANRFLWTFKLRPPVGGFVKKSKHFAEGGDAGNREQYINELIKRMI